MTTRSLERVVVKGTTPSIRVPLGAHQVPLYAHVSASGPTGIRSSFYDPLTHTWLVEQLAAVTGAVEVSVQLLVLNDPGRIYDVHITVSHLKEATRLEEVVGLTHRSCTLKALRAENSTSGSSEAQRSFCPVDGCVTLTCVLPSPSDSEGRHYHLCGGGFYSDYPVCAAQPTRVAPNDEGVAKAAASENFNGWSVTATPNLGLSCMAIGIALRDVSSRFEDDEEMALTAAHPLDGELAAWFSKRGLHVALDGEAYAVKVKIPFPQPEEFVFPKGRSSQLRESLDFFYS